MKMNRRSFFNRLFKTAAIMAVAPSVIEYKTKPRDSSWYQSFPDSSDSGNISKDALLEAIKIIEKSNKINPEPRFITLPKNRIRLFNLGELV